MDMIFSVHVNNGRVSIAENCVLFLFLFLQTILVFADRSSYGRFLNLLKNEIYHLS